MSSKDFDPNMLNIDQKVLYNRILSDKPTFDIVLARCLDNNKKNQSLLLKLSKEDPKKSLNDIMKYIIQLDEK